MEQDTMLRYLVGADSRIVAIEGPWDEFARSNDATGLTRENVLGRSLFDFISGSETAELVGLLLARARKGAVRPVPFRCDAPSRRRFLRLELHAEPGSSVRCDSWVEREEDRLAEPLLDAKTARGGGVVVICSWCKRVRLGKERWVEVEEAAAPLRLFGPGIPRLSHGVCEACSESIRKSWGPSD